MSFAFLTRIRVRAITRQLAAAAVLAGGLFGLQQEAAAAICPVTASTNTDCGFILTIGAGGVITGTPVTGANPYDGADDALVGIINNSGATFSGSIALSGTGNGGGIFGFDGDGICAYIACSYSHPTGYEGPLVTFSGINASETSGLVNVAGLLNGATTYFSLEGSPASISAGGGIGVPAAVPEPETWALLAAGLAMVGFFGQRRRR